MSNITTVFLDRDGVINHLRSDYVLSWETFVFLPRALDALRLLSAAGMRIIVVTNQRAVARGLLSIVDLEAIHARMCAEAAVAGATIHHVYYCPHEKGQCSCRKPDVGMFLQAQRDFPAIQFERSAVVGDSLTDMQAGQQLGCQLYLVTGSGCADRVPQETGALAAAHIPLQGSAPTLYEVVVRHLLPVPARITPE